MNSSLLEEAIVDAQKLRELAEQTAKNKIVEAVMPQIREMINKKILGESLEELDATNKEENENIEEEENIRQDESLAEVIANLVSERQNSKQKNAEEKNSKKLDKIEESILGLKMVLSEKLHKINKNNSKKIAKKIIESTENALELQENLILNENTTSKSFKLRLEKSIKELKDMARKNRNIFDFLFEENSSRRLNEATFSIDFSDEEVEELGDSYEKLRDMFGEMGIEIGDGGESDLEDDEDSDDDLDSDDEDSDDDLDSDDEDSDDDLDLGDEDSDEDSQNEAAWGRFYEMDDSSKQESSKTKREKLMASHAHMQEYDEKNEDDTKENEVVESLMRRLSCNNRRIRENAADMADHYGGAKVIGDVILDLDEEDLINVLADELGKYDNVSMPKMRTESNRRRRTNSSFDRNYSRLQESVAQAKFEANKYRKAASELKGQLNEMNLFNAKLLYANKLMQNKDLTTTQQRSIVEALDNAKTIREAKLLFESLTESLNRRVSKTKPLSEGMIRPTGLASKSTRSAAPANASGVDSDRWAILAGIEK